MDTEKTLALLEQEFLNYNWTWPVNLLQQNHHLSVLLHRGALFHELNLWKPGSEGHARPYARIHIPIIQAPYCYTYKHPQTTIDIYSHLQTYTVSHHLSPSEI